ncbi:hypothetical protein ILUMI_16318, partial [Ignelater luminosus]
MKIANEYLEYVKGKSTAYEMWTALQQVFARKGANVADTTLNDNDPGEFSLLADPASISLPKDNAFVINCYLDSGVTEIMVNSVFLNKMTNVKELTSPIRVKTAKANEIVHATHTGDIKLVYIEDSIRNTISFTDIL